MLDVMPSRLQVLSEQQRSEHYYIRKSQVTCLFWGEYQPAREGDNAVWTLSPTNQLITNFKKSVRHKATGAWPHKLNAQQQVAQAFAAGLKLKDLLKKHRMILVPIPPSKAKSDPDFDSRMYDTLQLISGYAGVPLDVRDCLSFDGSLGSSHNATNRPSPDRLERAMTFDGTMGRPREVADLILLFDDLLTTGAHLVAAMRLLEQHFPNAKFVGCFIARRILPEEEIEPFANG